VDKLAFTIDEAVEAANISRSFLYKLIAEKRGPVFRKAGNRTLILKQDLERWLKSLPTTRSDETRGG
jgi:excisionase family DNA binding protein